MVVSSSLESRSLRKCLPLTMRALRFFETSRTSFLTTQYHIQEGTDRRAPHYPGTCYFTGSLHPCRISRALLHLSCRKSRQRNLSRFPNEGPYGEIYPFPVPSFTCLSNSSTRVLLIKRNFTPLSKALGKELPPMVHMATDAHFQSRTLGVPSKAALPPSSPHSAPTERCSVSRALLHSSF